MNHGSSLFKIINLQNSKFLTYRIFLKLITSLKVLLIGFFFGASNEYASYLYVMAITNACIMPMSDIIGIIFSKQLINNKPASFKKYYNLCFPGITILTIILFFVSIIICNFNKDFFNLTYYSLIPLVFLYSFICFTSIVRTAFATYFWCTNGIRRFTIKYIFANIFGLIVFLSIFKFSILAIPLSLLITEISTIILISNSASKRLIFSFSFSFKKIYISINYLARFFFPLASNLSTILFTLSEQAIATSISISFLPLISYSNLIINNIDSFFGLAEKSLSLISEKSADKLPKILGFRVFIIVFLFISFLIIGTLIEINNINFGNLSSGQIRTIFYISSVVILSNILSIQQSILYRSNVNKGRGKYSLLATLLILTICYIYSVKLSWLAFTYPIIIYSSIHYIYNLGRLLSEYLIFKRFTKYTFFQNEAHG